MNFINAYSTHEDLTSPLLMNYQLNSYMQLKNRCVMAPMTRCFAQNGEPNEAMVEYYGRRNGFGLLISEATMISQDASGYPNTPGIYSESQISKWRKITEKVHESGSRFFMQLWHAGMMSHRNYRNGKQTIAASDILQIKGNIPRTNGSMQYEAPRPMDKSDIDEIKSLFVKAAQNAFEAGFDGVELHAANGYLLDSFLHYFTNKRQDEYGPSGDTNEKNTANMCRLILEIVDEIIKLLGTHRIGIRLSPVPVLGMKNMTEDERDYHVFKYLLAELSKRGITYVHASTDNDIEHRGGLDHSVSHFLKQHFEGTVIGCGAYTVFTGAKSLLAKEFDLLAFGKLAIANPNLVDLIYKRQFSNIVDFRSQMLDSLY